MKEITEPEMLHRAAAYCSTAERCIQDVQKKIDAAGLPPDASERMNSTKQVVSPQPEQGRLSH